MSSESTVPLRDALKHAVAIHRSGDLKEAARLYRAILQVQANEPDANHNLGIIERETGHAEASLPYFLAAVTSHPAIEPYHLSYAQTLLDCRRADEALEVLKNAQSCGLNSKALQEQIEETKAAATDIRASDGNLTAPQRSQLFQLLQAEKFVELETLLAQLLAQDPQAGILWKFQGVCLTRLRKNGQFALERAAALLPNDAEAQRNCVPGLYRDGKLQEALAYLRRTLSIHDQRAGDHIMLADMLRDAGQIHEAIASYRRALELAPNSFVACNNLGNVLKDVGLRVDAITCYQQAIAIKPDCVEALCNLSLLHKGQGNHAAAVDACNKALQIAPDLAGALVIAGDLAIDNGHFEEAESLFRRATNSDPRLPEAWAGIARTRKMTLDDVPWAQQAGVLADSLRDCRTTVDGVTSFVTSQILEQECLLRYALGKYFDDVKDHDQAFPHFLRANILDKQRARSKGKDAYSPDEQELAFDQIISQFDRTRISDLRGAHPAARPVFVIGMPRSGTSLVEQILASHPEVFGAGELPYWSLAADACSKAKEENRLHPQVFNTLAVDFLKLLHGLAPEAQRVVDKMPYNFINVGLIHSALPNARFIHMQRNPIDVCLSIYFNAFSEAQKYANDLDNLAHYYRQYERLMAHWRAVLPAGVMLDVPYESLVEDQESWSRKMIDLIGLPWDEACLEFHAKARAVRTPSNWQVRQKITRASVERWRNYEKFVGPLRGLLES